MWSILVFIAILYLAVIGIARLVPLLLSWICNQLFSARIQVGTIKILSLALHDLRISKDGLIVEVERLKVSSSFLKRNVTRPLTLTLSDVRVEIDLNHRKAVRRAKTSPNGASGPVAIDVPPWALSLVQFVGLEVEQGSIMLLKMPHPEGMLIVTGTSLDVHGTVTSPTNGTVILTLKTFAFRLLQGHSAPCLAEVSCSVRLETQFTTDTGLQVVGVIIPKAGIDADHASQLHWYSHSIEIVVRSRNAITAFSSAQCWTAQSKVSAGTSYIYHPNTIYKPAGFKLVVAVFWNMNPAGMKMELDVKCNIQDSDMSISEGILTFLAETKPALQQDIDETPALEMDRSSPRWISLVPRNLDLIVTSLSAAVTERDRNQSLGLHLGQSVFTYHVRDWVELLQSTECSVYVHLTASSLELRDGHLSLVTWSHIGHTLELLPSTEVEAGLNIQSLRVNYFHSIAARWLPKLPTQRSNNKLKLSQPEPISRRFSKVTVQFDLNDIGGSLSFEPDHVLKANIVRLKSTLETDQDSNSVEILLESLSCDLRQSPCKSDIHPKKFHIWHVPLYLGNAVISLKQLSSSRSVKSSFEYVQLEWSDQLMETLCMIHAYLMPLIPVRTMQQNLQETPVSQETKQETKATQQMTLEMSITNLNVFVITKGDYCLIYWHTTMHLALLHALNSFRQLMGAIMSKSGASVLEAKERSDVSKSPWELRAKISGNFSLQLLVSSDHTVELITGKKWSAAMIHVVFPYEYNFAEAYSEKLVGVIKWLKQVHKRTSEPFRPNAPLPPDLSIKVKSFLMELCDDPFEVNLHENYILMEDESKEITKRENVLEAKYRELTRNHFSTDAKWKELLKQLQHRNAEIYIQRSRKIREMAPPRTQLLGWEMTDMDLLIMADPDFHGVTNAMRHMVDIDPDSPLPADGLNFSILWCRTVNLDCKNVGVTLRDYPQSLIDFTDFHLWGRLLGAEQKPTWRAIRTCAVEVGHPWENATVERSMMPLKFFYDFSCDVGRLSFAYGPCWEPALAQCKYPKIICLDEALAVNVFGANAMQVNVALEFINRPSLDSSPLLPWWD
ncbi:unnamed protein product, partial [Darwinula stevensoni]